MVPRDLANPDDELRYSPSRYVSIGSTGNPQITFFKVVYRRHTNFSMECIEQTLTGSPDFGRKVSVTILRNGDLATKLYLRVVLNSVVDASFAGKFAWVRRLGHELINNIDVEIGGSQIDKHYGTWMDVWYELTHTSEQERGYKKCIGDVPELTQLVNARADGTFKDPYTMFIPLQFWFCRNPGLSLPLIALQYHEVRLNIEFNPANKLGVFTAGFNTRLLTMQDATLLVDYIYLDTEERRRFAQIGHEYLIEQLQFTGTEAVPTSTSGSTTQKVKLQFNHPTKELIWAMQGGNFTTGQSFLAYTHLDDWTSALDDAALNMATGMFIVATTDPAVTHTELCDAGGSFPTNALATHNINVDVSGALASGYHLYLRKDVFTASSNRYNLGDKIDFVAITINADGDDISTIKVLAHTMSIRDISIPVSTWTDARLNNVSGVNPNDIVVYQWHNFGVLLDGTGNPVSYALIQLNGHDRFDQREGSYFNYVQPLQHHTRTPCDGINVYSFALHPEQHQPTGTANLSRIDSTMLNLTLLDPTLVSAPEYAPSLNFFTTDTNLYVYGFNYNVLRIMSGINASCAKQETPLSDPDYSDKEKVWKNLGSLKNDLYNLLVQLGWATFSNCGKLLRAFITTSLKKFIEGTRLIAEPNSKNMKDWTIRSQASSAMMRKVQRLDGNGYRFDDAQGTVQLAWKHVRTALSGGPRIFELNLRSVTKKQINMTSFFINKLLCIFMKYINFKLFFYKSICTTLFLAISVLSNTILKFNFFRVLFTHFCLIFFLLFQFVFSNISFTFFLTRLTPFFIHCKFLCCIQIMFHFNIFFINKC